MSEKRGRVKREASPVILHGAGNFRKREFSLCPEPRYPETITTSYVTVRINNSRQTTGESSCISRAHRGLPNNGRPNGTRFHARNYIYIYIYRDNSQDPRGGRKRCFHARSRQASWKYFPSALLSGNRDDVYAIATYMVSALREFFFFFWESK